jgi:hypothetical protein
LADQPALIAAVANAYRRLCAKMCFLRIRRPALLISWESGSRPNGFPPEVSKRQLLLQEIALSVQGVYHAACHSQRRSRAAWARLGSRCECRQVGHGHGKRCRQFLLWSLRGSDSTAGGSRLAPKLLIRTEHGYLVI